MKRIFYDLVHSPDDGGWYCNAFDKKGKDVYDTSVHFYKSDAVAELKKKYPQAELLKIID